MPGSFKGSSVAYGCPYAVSSLILTGGSMHIGCLIPTD